MHGGPADRFRKWIDEASRQLVTDGNSAWTLSHVWPAAAKGFLDARKGSKSITDAEPTDAELRDTGLRLPPVEAELGHIASQMGDGLTEVLRDRLARGKKPAQIANDMVAGALSRLMPTERGRWRPGLSSRLITAQCSTN